MEELVEKAKKKDEKAFDELILAVKKEMYLITKTKLKNEEDIADVMQETIYYCYKNLKKLRNNKFFKTWLIRILINECNKFYNHSKNKNNVSLEENEIENYIGTEDDPFSNIEFDILIKNLKEDEKIIMTLYYYSQYSTKEISKILKINEGTIRSKLSRAKTKLKNQYKGEFYG